MSPAHAVPLRSVPAARRPLGTAPAAATTHEPVVNAPADDAAVTHLRALADAHRTFIEQQTRVHALFLGSRGPVRAPIRTEDGGAREVTSHPVASHAAPLLPAPFEAGPPLEAPTSVERQCPEPTRPNATSVAGPAAGSRTPTGPAFSREQLEVHGSGRISELFGPLFEVQDGYERQVRMPEPPLLLADRVTGVDAEPGIAGRGVMWTETDVTSDAWYLNRGRMPAGVLIESGQADLMLISYMGADLRNRGERVYRLLGCELTFEDELPLPGETLKYEIHVDGHAKHGDVRLFFFHYDCLVDGVPRITVRGGQAGFFSDAELAASEGVQWSPEHGERTEDPRLDPPQVLGARRAFDVAQVRAFAEGRLWECFGDEFDLARTHTASPSIQTGDMLFLDEVTDFQPGGGPWGRGYLRAVSAVTPDAWFFQGHFKNDPCMPGTLMFEACLQAQSFLMAALGYTTTRDGWRFEPVQGESIPMVCRGQVTPASHELVYEVFVDEIVAGPEPTLYADVLCSVDGHKAFHARRVGLRLVPDWPLPLTDTSAVDDSTGRPVAVVHDRRGGEFAFGYESLLACALGRPSAAFGPLYEGRDGPVRVPRLPGPPYHFMSRVIEVDGEIGGMQDGSRVVVDYDIDGDEWYFDDNGFETMPHAVLLEAALQPCGWLASYVGAALTTDEELCFRNLDGTGTLHEEVRRGSKVLRTESTLTGISVAAGVIIVNFDVECTVEGRTVYSVKTVFGFFPPESLARQVGQPTTDDERLLALGPSDEVLDLADRPERYFGGAARLASGRLGMLDRITTVRRDGGRDGLGHYRAERDIDPADWYFRAHFFQDPVQPGSLGIEAMIELLQFAMLDQDLDRDLADPRFEPLALGVALTWKYRGQVIPSNEKVTVTVELSSISRSDDGVVATARAALWCDGVKIYSAEDLGMRIVSGEPAGGPGGGPGRVGGAAEPLRPRGLACLVDTGAGGGRSAIDVAAVGEYWSRLLGVPTRWLGGDLMRGLMSRYLRNVVVEDADAFEAVTVGGAIYLANHQVQIESVLMTQVLSAVTATPLVTIANAKHRNGWPGWLESVLCSYPGARDPESIAYFDPADRASMFEILETVKPDLAAGRRALFLHPQGTRSRVAPDPVSRVSSLFLDLAIDAGVPIVPTRFVGGLPEEPLDGKLELPLGHGAQDFHIARPITAAELVSHPYGERRTLVLEALRSVGPIEERPHPGSVEFEAEVDRWAVQTGARQVESAFMRTLAGVDDPSEETLELLGGAAAGVLEHDDDERGRWLAGVARVLYGPSGAAVRAG
jgi:3-hydroxymyristoyl/3-hydroxydecanoyl-(acyl carrier protein) dehydratase